jgi:hypothetical protein
LKGKTADVVIKAARATLSTQIQQAVTAGQVPQAQADAQLADFDQVAPQFVNNTGGPGRGFDFGPRGPGSPRGEDALINAAASITRLTTQDLMTQLQAGQSLAQIATTKSQTADDVIKAARPALSTQLQ